MSLVFEMVRLVAPSPVDVFFAGKRLRIEAEALDFPPHFVTNVRTIEPAEPGRWQVARHATAAAMANAWRCGFIVQADTHLAKIFARLVAEGRAAIVIGPHCSLHHSRGTLGIFEAAIKRPSVARYPEGFVAAQNF